MTGAAHYEQIPAPELQGETARTVHAPEREPPRRAQGHSRDNRVVSAVTDLIAMGRDAVAAVAVVDQRDRAEVGCIQLSEFAGQTCDKGGVGTCLRRRSGKPGNVHHPVVHAPTLMAPVRVGDEPRHQRSIVLQPAGPVLDPCAVGEHLPIRRRHRSAALPGRVIEQGALHSRDDTVKLYEYTVVSRTVSSKKKSFFVNYLIFI